MTNIARFTINGSASTNGGVDVSNSAAVTLALEASPGVVAQRVVYSVYDSSDVNSPLASKSAPTLTLDNGAGSTGQSVQASTPNANVTTTAPASGQHSYLVRCTVNGGVNANGEIDSDYVFERMLTIRSGANLRKTVHGEGTAYSQRSVSDAQNELVDAYATVVTPVVTNTYTANDTWTKPANAVFVDITVVGPGGDGGTGANGSGPPAGGGGGGGGAGDVVRTRLRASDLPSTLSVVVTAGGSGSSTFVSGTGFALYAGPGADGGNASGATGGTGGTGDTGRKSFSIDGGNGGVGNAISTSSNGSNGDNDSTFAGGARGLGGSAGSPAGNPGSGGSPGYGYGAGGGGGGGGEDASVAYYGGGGGGGAGGYGSAAVATAGSNGSGATGGAGGSGAQGVVIITTWCAV